MKAISNDQIEKIKSASSRATVIASLGIEILELKLGYCRIRAPFQREFAGMLPGFHGGILAAIADCASWFAIATSVDPNERLTTTDLYLHYLKPCMSDAVASASVTRLGRLLCPTTISIHDESGLQVVTGNVSYLRLNALNSR